MALDAGAQRLVAAEGHLDRTPGDVGRDGDHALDRDLELPAEPAADGGRDDADLLARQVEHLRQLLARLERRLLGGADDDGTVLVDVRERCERLEVRVILALGREVALDHVRCRRERGIDVADDVRQRLADIAGGGLDELRCIPLQRVAHIEHARDDLVLDLDELRRRLGLLARVGEHEAEWIAGEADEVEAEDGLVGNCAAVRVQSRHVGRGDDAVDTRGHLGLARVERDDARVCMLGPDDLAVEHAFHRQVVREGKLPLHALVAVEQDRRGAHRAVLRLPLVIEFLVLEPLRRLRDRVEDRHEAGAAADVLLQALADLVLGRASGPRRAAPSST